MVERYRLFSSDIVRQLYIVCHAMIDCQPILNILDL
jgi:hypothetical protein